MALPPCCSDDEGIRRGLKGSLSRRSNVSSVHAGFSGMRQVFRSQKGMKGEDGTRCIGPREREAPYSRWPDQDFLASKDFMGDRRVRSPAFPGSNRLVYWRMEWQPDETEFLSQKSKNPERARVNHIE